MTGSWFFDVSKLLSVIPVFSSSQLHSIEASSRLNKYLGIPSNLIFVKNTSSMNYLRHRHNQCRWRFCHHANMYNFANHDPSTNWKYIWIIRRSYLRHLSKIAFNKFIPESSNAICCAIKQYWLLAISWLRNDGFYLIVIITLVLVITLKLWSSNIIIITCNMN